MPKSLKSRKSKDKIDPPPPVDPSDSLLCLLSSSERLKTSLYHQKSKSPTLSLTVDVITCVNNVLSEYGEESIKRQRFKNDLFVSKSKEGTNGKWTSCVKVLQELVTCGRDLDAELCSLVLLLIAQVHERQSLRIVDNSVLNEVIMKWVGYIDCVEAQLLQQYTRCLASFILGNLNGIPKETFTTLSGTFFRISERYIATSHPDTNALETLKYCISGLTNLCYLVPSSDGSEIDDFLAKRFQTCGRFFNLFVLCLEKLPLFIEFPQVSMFRMQHQCLHGLNYVSQRPHGLSLDNTERLLTVLRVYCGFGMFKTSLDTSAVVTTDNGDNYMSRAESGADNHINDMLTLGNSGEHYDSDEVVHSAFRPMRKWEIKTRRLAMELLQKVLSKSWRKMASIVWAYFMPATAWGTRIRFNLLNVLERERDGSQKIIVLKAIQQCIVNCRDLLASAQHQTTSSTFVSRSHNLASVIDEIHQRLLATLVTDRNSDQGTQIKVATLQCLLVLIRGVPYHRLRPTIVHSVMRGLRQVFLESQSGQTDLRCAVLDCFTSLVSFESVSDEMRQLLLSPSTVSLRLPGTDSHDCGRQPSWLVQLCVRLAHPALVAKLWTSPLSSESWDQDMDPLVEKVVSEGALETNAEVRCQALMTVGAMLSQHATLIRPSLDTLKKTLLACLKESLNKGSTNSGLRSHVLRVFSGFLSTLENKKVKRYLGIVQDTENAANEFSETPLNYLLPSDNNEELSMDWWSSFLDMVMLCLHDPDDGVRASATQCMSMMSESILERLVTTEQREKCCTILMDMFKDKNMAVCCQAVWALGYWVAMRPLNVDLHFIRKLVDACHTLSVAAIDDSSVYVVCANATWSLSNIMEVLVAHKDGLLSCCKDQPKHNSCGALVREYLSNVTCIDMLMKLFCDLCGLKKAGQMSASARIHENAIRGLGYVCRFVDDVMVRDPVIRVRLLASSHVFCDAILLADKAGRVKVKWNACLSSSHVFRNQALTRDLATFDLETVIDTLLSTVASDRYFKVRNNALLSLVTLVDCCGRKALGSDLVRRLVVPLAGACVSVANKSSVPFSEVHRHCLCLYLIKLLLLKLLAVMTSASDWVDLDLDTETTLSCTFSSHMPLIWQHLHHLNRSFNKQTLLTGTLMNPLSVTACSSEVDNLLTSLSTSLLSPLYPQHSLILALVTSVLDARTSSDQVLPPPSSDGSLDVGLSDDDGLLTKRPGASLIFSQIYD